MNTTKETPNDWVCFAIIEIPLHSREPEIILVQDADKPPPHYWKLPGGRRKKLRDRTPLQTIERELREELPGIFPNIAEPIYEEMVDKEEETQVSVPYTFFVWAAEPLVITARELRTVKRGDEILRIERFPLSTIRQMIKNQEILVRHAEALTQYFIKRGYQPY